MFAAARTAIIGPCQELGACRGVARQRTGKESPMRSLRVSSQAAVAALLLALALMGAGPVRAQSLDANLLVYHQITNLTGGTGSVGFPVLSADGGRVAFFAPD